MYFSISSATSETEANFIIGDAETLVFSVDVKDLNEEEKTLYNSFIEIFGNFSLVTLKNAPYDFTSIRVTTEEVSLDIVELDYKSFTSVQKKTVTDFYQKLIKK